MGVVDKVPSSLHSIVAVPDKVELLLQVTVYDDPASIVSSDGLTLPFSIVGFVHVPGELFEI